ncbi:hypothetical protein XELAEV_18037615mg [Xenopus laevis]|uniref:Uncharacterized protein n=1 Tax=Xenopus laevis TaxID=8355 RepID=A0A974CD66_XENLA|nr:hypothetical protein XELAEV_18037615mg [Xenopus laevis]
MYVCMVRLVNPVVACIAGKCQPASVYMQGYHVLVSRLLHDDSFAFVNSLLWSFHLHQPFLPFAKVNVPFKAFLQQLFVFCQFLCSLYSRRFFFFIIIPMGHNIFTSKTV